MTSNEKSRIMDLIASVAAPHDLVEDAIDKIADAIIAAPQPDTVEPDAWLVDGVPMSHAAWQSGAKTRFKLYKHPPAKPDTVAVDELNAWKESAAQMARNADFYQGIVEEIGEMFGSPAYTSDDGSIQDDVLALRVPELVRALLDQEQ